MADYQKMYYILCGAASTALDRLPDGQENESVRVLLQTALHEAEELYIESAD